METKVQLLLNKFDGGAVCCFSCAVVKVGLAEDFLDFMKKHGYKPEKMTTIPVIWEWLQRQTFTQKEFVLLRVCLSALQFTHQDRPSPVLHPGFFQRKDIEIKYQFGDYKIMMGTLRKGSVLQIYKKPESYDIVDNVLESLKRDFLTPIPHLAGYTVFPDVEFNEYLSINLTNGYRESGSLVRGQVFKTTTKPGYWKDLNSIQQQDDIRNAVNNMRSVKLFIVENAFRHDMIRFVSVSRWLRFLASLFPNHRDVTTIFVFDYMDFDWTYLERKMVRRHVNNELTEDETRRMFWMDTSSTRFRIPHAYDAFPKLFLEIRPFDDGCV